MQKIIYRCEYWNWDAAVNTETELPLRMLKLSYRAEEWASATAPMKVRYLYKYWNRLISLNTGELLMSNNKRVTVPNTNSELYSSVNLYRNQ
jgi:hypothetical protein